MDRVGCATRKVSLRVAQVMWSGGCWRGVLLRHWLGGRGSVTEYGEAGNVCIRAIYLQTLW